MERIGEKRMTVGMYSTEEEERNARGRLYLRSLDGKTTVCTRMMVKLREPGDTFLLFHLRQL